MVLSGHLCKYRSAHCQSHIGYSYAKDIARDMQRNDLKFGRFAMAATTADSKETFLLIILVRASALLMLHLKQDNTLFWKYS